MASRVFPQIPIRRVPTLHERYVPDSDVVIATWWETAYHVNRYGKSKGRKLYYVRGYEVWSGNEKLVKRTYHLPFEIIVTSSYLKRVLYEKEGVMARAVIPNGVNFALFYREKRSKKEDGPLRIGMMFRRLDLKGMEDGLKAFKLASKTFPSLQLVLLGEKPDVRLPKGTEVRLFPPVERLRTIYNSLDVFMYPSREGEGFGNPPLEAMACGIACVLTRAGGVPDYTVQGQTALVSEPGEWELWLRIWFYFWETKRGVLRLQRQVIDMLENSAGLKRRGGWNRSLPKGRGKTKTEKC